MANETLPDVHECLRTLASQPGVLWSGLMNRNDHRLISVNCDGSARASGPAECVLIEAIMTASTALAERLGLGLASEWEHRFENGSLLVLAPEPHCCLIVCHSKGAPMPLLRMALRDVASSLPPPNAPTEFAPFDVLNLSDSSPLGDFADFGTLPARDASHHSEVYNPFTSA